MSGESFLYQLGGYKGHTGGWCSRSESLLAENVFRTLADRETGRLELILGIRISGASNLLLTCAEYDRLARVAHERPYRNPTPLSKFSSLSPIAFESVDELAKKLKTYTQRANRTNTAKQRAKTDPHDTSQANRIYSQGTVSLRYTFEEQRLLIRSINGELDCQRFCVDPVESLRESVFITFHAQTWEADERRRSEIYANPKVLSVTWTVTKAQDLKDERGTTKPPFIKVEFLVAENALFSNKNMPRVAETKSSEEIRTALQGVLREHSSVPVFFLVHDAAMSESVLKHLGVNSTKWSNKVSDVLKHRGSNPRHWPPTYERSGGSTSRRDDHDYRGYGRYDRRHEHSRRSRGSRSRSPNHAGRPRSPTMPGDRPFVPRSTSTPGDDNSNIHIIDVQKLHQVLFTSFDAYSINEIAEDLDVHNEPEILHNWIAMASGEAIDEQRDRRNAQNAERRKRDRYSNGSTNIGAGGRTPADDEDSDIDPNDVVIRDTQVHSKTAENLRASAYESGSEDEYDF